MRVGIRLVGVLFVGLSACSGTTAPPEPALDVQYWNTSDGATLEYDVVSGTGGGRGAPVVVLLHGFTGDARVSMSDWSDELQSAGMTVLNADWFPAGTNPPTPTADGALATLGAVACAIDHARAVADEYGGDPGNVIVVGVSAGAYEALLATLAWDQFDHAGCSAPVGPPPEVVVALAGVYDAAQRGPLASALADSPNVLRLVDPFEHADVPSSSRFVLVHGAADPLIPKSVAEAFVARAVAAGTRAELQVVDGGKHFEFGTPATMEGVAALSVILVAAGVE